MTTMFQRSKLLASALVLAGLVMVACSPMKEPAAAAIKDATTTLQKIAPEAMKYAPAEYAAVNEQVVGMQTAFDKKEYDSVINTVRKLAPNLRLLAEKINNNRRDALIAMKEQWKNMLVDVPKSLAVVEARIAALGKSHALPKGLSKDALAGAGSTAAAVKQAWSDAQSAQSAGNVEDAVAKGKDAQTKLSELVTLLGLGAPHAATK